MLPVVQKAEQVPVLLWDLGSNEVALIVAFLQPTTPLFSAHTFLSNEKKRKKKAH